MNKEGLLSRKQYVLLKFVFSLSPSPPPGQGVRAGRRRLGHGPPLRLGGGHGPHCRAQGVEPRPPQALRQEVRGGRGHAAEKLVSIRAEVATRRESWGGVFKDYFSRHENWFLGLMSAWKLVFRADISVETCFLG